MLYEKWQPFCSVNRVNIGSDNGLSLFAAKPLSLMAIGPLGTNFSEIQIKIPNFSFVKMHLKMLSKMAAILSRGT